MATVLNRTTLDVIYSANTPDYGAGWLVHPDLSPVAGVPHRYWKLTGDTLSEMNAQEKAAVDATLLAAARDGAAAQLTDAENIQRAMLLLLLDDRNMLAGKINAILTAVDNAATLAALKTSVAAIADAATYSESQLRTAIKAKLGT